jgi:TP901 family phage tail tape measure protein
MANIQLNIVALGDFTSVNTQIKALQTQVESLQKSIAGVGLNANLTSQLKNIQTEFSNALLSSGNFTKQTVQLTSETQKFGQALQSGKLSLGQYFGIITGRSAEAQKAVGALAVEQVKLNNSIVQTDITKQGVYSVYTPTKINEISKATEIAAAKQNIYNLAVKEGSTQLINFGKNTQWAGRQLTVGLAMPAILFGSQAVAAFKSVNTELTRLQRLYGEGLTPPSQTQITQISSQVLNLGKQIAEQMGIAQSETVKVAANFAAMGKQGQDLLDITTQTQRLSKLGAIDATQATNTIVSLQNVYKVSTVDLANAVNFMSSMQKQTTMSLQDMTDAIPRVGPIMAQLGGSYKDTAVMLLAMREAGVPAAQAANALKSAFASIIAPTSAATKEFAQFGINLNSIKSAGTPVQMLMQLQAALVGIAPLAREQLIDKLFGKFQFARVSALLENFGKVGSQTQNALKVAGATNAELATLAGQEMAQATESTTAKWQRAIETLKADLYPIGQKILEVGAQIINFGQKIADFFNHLPGPIKSGLGILLTLGVIAGPIIMITGLLANLMGQGMKVGYSLLGIIDGTKKWKDLMTPASIASKVATDSLQAGLLENVTAVDTLNAALQRLISSLESINMNFNASMGGSLLNKVEAAATAEVSAGELILPGMAAGGIVPGYGSGDTYAAMLTPGEAVVPKNIVNQHAPLISALISGNLPGYAEGLDPNGNSVIVQRGHAYSSHNQDILEKARALLPTQSRLNSVDDVTKGVMVGMTSDLNQSVRTGRSGMSSSGVANQLERYQTLTGKGGVNLDPMADLKIAASKLGADMSKAGPMLDQAYQDMIKELKNGSEKMFGKKTGQVSLEAWMEEQLKPTLSKIQTQVGGNLSGALERVATTRGRQTLKNGQEKPGATGSTYWVDNNGNLIPLKDANIGLSSADVSTSGRAVPGAISKSKKTGTTLVNDIKVAAQAEAGIKSPSEVFKNEVGIQIAQGTMAGVEEGISGSTGQSKIQSIFDKAFGANSRMGGMMSKFSGMGMMGRIGVGMGLGAVTQMASPLIDKIPGGSFISSAMSGASMGAGFGPWGIAAGAALSLVTHGITSLINMEKQHAAEAKADFTSSANAVEFLGGKVVDTTSHLQNLNIILNNSTSGTANSTKVLGANIAYTNQQLDNFATMVKSLPKDNALSLVIQQVKDAGDSGSAAKIASEFATLQMAINNITPDQAKQLQQLILTVGGKDASAARTPVANQIDAITSSLNSSLPNSKQFAQVIGQITSAALNSNSLDSVNMAIKAIGASSATAQQQVAGLLMYFTQLGNSGAIQLITAMQNAGSFSGGDILKTLAGYQAGATINFPTLKTDLNSGGAIDKSLTDAQAARTTKLKEIADLQGKLTKLTDANTSSTIANGAAVKANVPQLTAQQKVLDANLKSLQDLQKQTTQNTDYATTKEDLKNQILMAQSTGDNLKVQLLQQQLLGTSSTYNLQNKIDAAQQASDKNKSMLDNANLAATNAQTSAQNANTKAINDLQAQIAAAQQGLNTPNPGKILGVPKIGPNYGIKSSTGGKGHAIGGSIYGPGSSTSDSIPAMLSNGEYVVNAGAVAHYGKGTFDALNARHLAKGGVARTNSSITYHKQHMNRIARHFADGGYVPSSVSGLMSLSSFPHFAAGGAVNSIKAGTNVVYNVNVSVDKIDSTVDMKKAIDEALKSAESRAKMSGSRSYVGV